MSVLRWPEMKVHIRRLGFIPISLLLILAFSLSSASASKQRALSESIRIKRLGGLGRLWGAIKYSHPKLATEDIDWDKALVETIPLVNAAENPIQYKQAIDHLLAFLSDPITRSEFIDSGKNPVTNGGKSDAGDYLQTRNGAVVVEVAGLNTLRAQSGQKVLNEAIQQMLVKAENASGIVFDCRNFGVDLTSSDKFFLDQSLISLTQPLISKDIHLGTSRYRYYSGYPPYSIKTSGNYSTGIMSSSVEILKGSAVKGFRKPVSVIIDRSTPNISDFLGGLQSAQVATIVSTNDWKGFADLKTLLPDDIVVFSRTQDEVMPDGSTGFLPDIQLVANNNDGTDISLRSAIETLSKPKTRVARQPDKPPGDLPPVKEKPYSEMAYPSIEYRLLSLFRYWNAINYFYPYRDLADEPWDGQLEKFIPRFEAAKNSTEYVLAVAEISCLTNDSHTIVDSDELYTYLGRSYPPLVVRSIRGATRVTRILDENAAKAANISLGDEIIKVDGEPVGKKIELLRKIFAASTPQSAQLTAHYLLLSGQADSIVRLKVRSGTEPPRETSIKRSASFQSTMAIPAPTLPSYTILPSGYGYIDLTRLRSAEVSKAFDLVGSTTALILDIRGYPHGTFTQIGSILARDKVKATTFYRPVLNPGTDYKPAGGLFMMSQTINPDPIRHYSGKVVVLINEKAISQSEHTCLWIEAARKTTFIGTPTNGTDGDITNIVLPGKIGVTFTGQGVRHGDGRQLQRIGIIPDVRVEPTAKGIREHRDEIMEAAIRFLDNNNQR